MIFEEIISKYYNDSIELKRVLEVHSLEVAKKALSIAKKHPELSLDEDFLFSASMLHDIGIIRTNAPKIFCFGTEPYICHGVIGAEILNSEKLPLHARVCERHTGTGLTLEDIISQNLPLPHKDLTPETMEEKVICYADKFFSKSNLNEERKIEKIVKSLKKYGSDKVECFLSWHKIFS